MENENLLGFYLTNQVIKIQQRHCVLTIPIGATIQVNEVRGNQISIKTSQLHKWVDKSFMEKLNKKATS